VKITVKRENYIRRIKIMLKGRRRRMRTRKRMKKKKNKKNLNWKKKRNWMSSMNSRTNNQ